MNRLLLSACAFVLLLTAASCADRVIVGSGSVKSEQRAVGGSFDKIDISAPVDAQIQVGAGSAASVQLNGYANVLKYIKMKVENGTLHIYVDDMVELHTERNVTAQIILPALVSVSISGSADANITGNVAGKQLDVDIAGSGDATVQSLNVSELNVELAGSASFTATGGSVNKANYEIAGSGEVAAFGLQTQETVIEVAGSGSAEVTALKTLDMDISGSGDVSYKGHPAINKDINGSGSVTDAN